MFSKRGRFFKFLRTLALSASFYACSEKYTLSDAPCTPTNEKEMLCDGVDNNCNLEVDEGCDDDGDGYCDAQMQLGLLELLAPETSAENDTTAEIPYYLQPDFACPRTFAIDPKEAWLFMDCDDENSLAHPTNTEFCNGFDDNCNGITDDVFPEKGKACYLNLSSREIIDASSVDTTTPTALENLCGPSAITCEYGALTCKDLGLSEEVCDGIDNDCNRIVDELIPAEPCYFGWAEVDGFLQRIDGLQEGSRWYGTLGRGECRSGYQTCTASCDDAPSYAFCEAGIIGGDQQCHDAITPLPEICDGKNNNCGEEGIDEEYDADSDVYTVCGTYAGQIEQMDPSDELVDCDDENASVNPGMLEIICNGKDDDCNRETIDATDLDEDTYPIDCDPAIPLDCDDTRDDDPDFCTYVGIEDCVDPSFSACAPCIHPNAPEICGDCRDNNCNGIRDEGAVSGTNHDFFLTVDCSGSMSDKNAHITDAIGRILWTDCHDSGEIAITTVFVGHEDTEQPFLAGIQESGIELRDHYAARFPTSCSGNEYMLDALAYGLCTLPAERFLTDAGEYASEYAEVCLPLQTEIITAVDDSGNLVSFHPLEEFLSGNEPSDLWRSDALIHILLLADEDAQSRFSYIDQWKIGQLARQAGVSIDMYILHLFFTPTTLGGAYGGMNQGYAYLICDAYDADMNCIGNSNGSWTDITAWAYSEEIGSDLVSKLTQVYCPEGIEEALREGTGEEMSMRKKYQSMKPGLPEKKEEAEKTHEGTPLDEKEQYSEVLKIINGFRSGNKKF